MNLVQITNDIHSTAKEKGWWSPPRAEDETLMLMVTELAEATEEIRAGTPDVYVNDQFNASHPVVFTDGKWYTTGGLDVAVLKLKPEGQLIEIVDKVIRLLDWAGWRAVDMSGGFTTSPERIEQFKSVRPVSFHFQLVKMIVKLENVENRDDLVAPIKQILSTAHDFIASRGYKMMDLIEMKQTYNKTRAYKHGGKVM